MKIPLDRGLKEAAKENMIMEHIITYHMIAFVCGFALDLLLGDPHALHPIRLIGTLIAGLEKKLLELQMRDEKKNL